MPKQEAVSFEESFIKSAMVGFPTMADSLQRNLGPAFGTKQYSKQEMIDLATWSPVADPQQRLQQAAQMLQQGQTSEQVTVALYPKLKDLIMLSGQSPQEQIKFANQLRGWIDQAEQRKMDKMILEGPPEETVDDSLPPVGWDQPSSVSAQPPVQPVSVSSSMPSVQQAPSSSSWLS